MGDELVPAPVPPPLQAGLNRENDATKKTITIRGHFQAKMGSICSPNVFSFSARI
jgi:hypothetical protein